MEEIHFEAQDKLPTVYDVAITIFSHATRQDSQIMKDVVHKYSKHLIETWQKSFGHNHVMSLTAVKY